MGDVRRGQFAGGVPETILGQNCPVQLKGRFRQDHRIALKTFHIAALQADYEKETRSWKWFCVLPSAGAMQANVSSLGGSLCLKKQRLDCVARGGQCNADDLRLKRRAQGNSIPVQRAIAAFQKVRPGGRSVTSLTGVALAPGSEDTLRELQR